MVYINKLLDPVQTLRNVKKVLLVSKRTQWEFASNRFDLGIFAFMNILGLFILYFYF